MMKGTTKLVNTRTGLMVCQSCGTMWRANVEPENKTKSGIKDCKKIDIKEWKCYNNCE